jgi:hypothetical protein
MFCQLYVVYILVVVVLSCSCFLAKSFPQSLLDEVIRETLADESFKNQRSYKSGSISSLCDGLTSNSEVARTACCTPKDTRVITDAMLDKGKLYIFSGPPETGRTYENSLPAVNTVKGQGKFDFNMPVEYINEDIEKSSRCKAHYNGTLHIIGRSTIHNVYHASKVPLIILNY